MFGGGTELDIPWENQLDLLSFSFFIYKIQIIFVKQIVLTLKITSVTFSD